MTESKLEEILAVCDSFERRGPRTNAVYRLSGNACLIEREEVQWPERITEKVVLDNRCDDLEDLLSSNRGRFDSALNAMAGRLQLVGQSSKPSGPKMG